MNERIQQNELDEIGVGFPSGLYFAFTFNESDNETTKCQKWRKWLAKKLDLESNMFGMSFAIQTKWIGMKIKSFVGWKKMRKNFASLKNNFFAFGDLAQKDLALEIKKNSLFSSKCFHIHSFIIWI